MTEKKNEYIIYTTEGFSIAPNENIDVKNCQKLGETCGNNPEEAKEKMLNDNPWIFKASFNRSKFIVRQLLTN